MKAPYGTRRWLANAGGAAALLLFTGGPAYARTLRVLVLGDSLAAGYGLAAADGFQAVMLAALRARGHDVQFVDAAVSGDTTAGGLARLDWALADGADAALVELGGNDGLRGLDPAGTETNLGAILDGLAARHIPVLLSGMVAPPNLGADYGRAFAAVFARLGARRGILYDPFFLEGVAANPALNQADHIHPNPEGVRLVVARLLPPMEQLLAKVPA
ncbi:MAG TPA: arylesterase [Acetobacteraceae bacterium]